MQLVAYGAQDIYLTGNPQITFFKVVYRRHTNFSMEAISQTLNGNTQGTDGSTATCTISRNGDLVSKVYVNYAGGASTNGSALIKEVELEIGGQRIDRHYQEWNDLWNELSTDESKAIGLKSMQRCIGNDGTGAKLVQVPLNFWFCRNPGLALPLIALQYHEVKIKFTWGPVGGGVTPNPDVVCDYIYLDTDERRRFAQVSHEYLIEQVQKEDKTVATQNGSNTHKLNFNHPVKELIWTTSADDELSAVKLTLNGHDRFSERDQEYFTLRQPFDYHTAVPKQNLPISARIGLSNNTVSNLTLLNSTVLEGVDNAAAVSDAAKINVLGTKVLSLDATIVANINVGDTLVLVVNTAPVGAAATPPATVTAAAVGTAFTTSVASLPGGKTVNLTGGFTDGTNIFETIVAANGGTVGKFNLFKTTNNPQNEARTSKMVNKINVYSFALKPEEHQPSGTCNFSRIDNANLIMTHSAAVSSAVTIYAVNYNVLRIMSGMGGLAYSN